MVKLSGFYRRISALNADPIINSVEMCVSHGKYPRGA